ncbi:MAG: hypothetical protein HZB33_15230 [Nitrospirae bacterium]|nr:hypothetical protein [Nitrospirota bacterium]
MENDDNKPLMADQIAMAAAEGRLEQFIKDELPDNEQARKLVSMMMGMTGMVPPQGMAAMKAFPEAQPGNPEGPEAEAGAVPAAPSEDILRAVGKADVRALNDLLKREHVKRSAEGRAPAGPGDEVDAADNTPPLAEKEVIDGMLRIASENSLSPDWIILRALKLYIEGYNRTGRL